MSKKIGDKTILQDVNLQIPAGGFMAVLGPNGAGKTTLLKILSLLMPPSAGQVRIAGHPAEAADLSLRRQIGVISHSTFLYGHLSAAENLYFYGRLYDVRNLRARVEAVLEEVGLRYYFHDPVRTFSRGMQQRLAIARAILHEPALLFFDEPYTGLDQHAIEILNGVLRRLHSERRTICLVTHNFEQGLDLADRVIILRRGRVVLNEETAALRGADFKKLYLEKVEG